MYQRGTIVLKNIFIINGVPIEMRQKHKVQTNFFLGKYLKMCSGVLWAHFRTGGAES